MTGPCEHCGNPDKSKWLADCKYKGDWPSRRAFVLSTFDPPCACDAYDEGQAELARSKNRHLFFKMVALVIVVAVILGAFWLARAGAAEPDLPAGYTCADVRAAVERYGRPAAMRLAKRKGATREQIAAAEKCLSE